MNAPHDLGPDFRNWMRDVPAMPDDLPERALRTTRRTRQGRRWPWSLLRRTPTAGASGEQDESQPPAPIPTTGGLSLAPIGGMTTMLSGTKILGLAAVAALAGALFVAIPWSPQTDVSAPRAMVGEPVEITPVTGSMQVLAQKAAGPCEEGGIEEMYACAGDVWMVRFDFDDDRLNGLQLSRHNRYSMGAMGYAVQSLTTYAENDGGSWVGTGYAYQDPETTGLHYRTVLQGHGGYEGLTAIINLDEPTFGALFEGTGVIVGPGLPDLPEPAPTTFQ